ncbi:MAG: hypothetical protein QNJ38_24495 [Prochloraceae cyanobacterium]|nr:hypothetical protein [Prochloraceae cyanobacterium]
MDSITNKNIFLQLKAITQKYLPQSLITFFKDYKYKFLNVYRSYKYNLSFVEQKQPISIIKNLLETTKKISRTARKTILFYPNYPYRKATIYQLCLALGYDVINNPKNQFDVGIYWKRYSTYFPQDPILSQLLNEKKTVLNYHCQDVSKTYIDRAFLEVFGYSTIIDPLTYQGQCVAKSDLNAQHDGKIIDCPLESKQSGIIYQKLIDNEVKKGQVVDFRVPIFKQTIPVVYKYLKKNLNAEQRFFGYPSLISVDIIKPREIFTSEEISNILQFCQKIGLDCGELDILRDKQDRRIYIIDANNTPSSRLLFEPLQMASEECILSYQQRQTIIEKLVLALQKEIFALDYSKTSTIATDK